MPSLPVSTFVSLSLLDSSTRPPSSSAHIKDPMKFLYKHHDDATHSSLTPILDHASVAQSLRRRPQPLPRPSTHGASPFRIKPNHCISRQRDKGSELHIRHLVSVPPAVRYEPAAITKTAPTIPPITANNTSLGSHNRHPFPSQSVYVRHARVVINSVCGLTDSESF